MTELIPRLEACQDTGKLADIGEWIVTCPNAEDLLARVRASLGVAL